MALERSPLARPLIATLTSDVTTPLAHPQLTSSPWTAAHLILLATLTYFAGSHEGARRAAVLYSLLGTCRLNKVNPWEWLSDVLVRINVASDDTAVSLLPMNWKKKPVG
jgi:hypothetical protein